MPKKQDVIKVTYGLEHSGNGYKETRSYDGSFGEKQLLRTLIGLYNDVVLGHKYNVEETISDDDLKLIGEVIVKLLGKGEIKNAN